MTYKLKPKNAVVGKNSAQLFSMLKELYLVWSQNSDSLVQNYRVSKNNAQLFFVTVTEL